VGCAFELALALDLWVIMARVPEGLVVVIMVVSMVLRCHVIHNR
jgi:hypothetical protein